MALHSLDTRSRRTVTRGRGGKQVGSGAFTVEERNDAQLVLRRREDYRRPRRGNVGRVEFLRSSISDALPEYERGELDQIMVRYTPKLADLMPAGPPDAHLGPATWSGYLRFDHSDPVTSNVDLRRALAHAIDREALAAVSPANLVVATGGVVPPALQGHTPDIALPYDPERARELMRSSRFEGELELAGMVVWEDIVDVIGRGWEEVFGREVRVHTWSWRAEEATQVGGRVDTAKIRVTGWFPGYADPEYFLRLLFQSDSRTNEGGSRLRRSTT
jgi:ABC-type oligopeptide transport system substrate-binding subunit